MELRNYQKISVNAVYNAWAKGLQNVCLQLATGGGKTAILSHVAKEHAGDTLVVTHRAEILSQISSSLSKNCVKHRIVSQKNVVREVIRQQIAEIGYTYHDPRGHCCVVAIDTFLTQKNFDYKKYDLIIQDEAHHVLRKNKWGELIAKFSHERGLFLTATPLRADGRGLGRHADGVIDCIISSIQMSDLIEQGYLTPYKIINPPASVNLSGVKIGSTGDYSAPQLRDVVHNSKIVGDVVSHYKKFAAGKLGITFAVDIESASEIAEQFKSAGVSAELVTGKTPANLRADIMRRFKNREIMQLVNVDLFGEGVDVPAIEVVSFARPTQSYALYAQQFGRALRPMEGKSHAIIIDHVDNVRRHGLPDAPRTWTLDSRNKSSGVIKKVLIKSCANPDCMCVYDRFKKVCPYCNTYVPPISRSTPEHVDGDLTEMDAEELKKLRTAIDMPPPLWPTMSAVVKNSVLKNHFEKSEAQKVLREKIAVYAAYLKVKKFNDSEIYRHFFINFGTDVLTAQALKKSDALELTKNIDAYITENFICS